MEQVGARRARHRAPARYRPQQTCLRGGLLLIFTFGITLGAIQEAWLARRYGWLAFLTIMEMIDVVLYFWIFAWWWTWIRQSGD